MDEEATVDEYCCKVFECADRLGLAKIRGDSKTTILLDDTGKTLRMHPSLSPRLLSEILRSEFLCISNDDLSTLLQSWGSGKKRKAASMEEEGGEADQLQQVIDECLARLPSRRPPRDCDDVFVA